ncbi:hypothetical protein ECE50_003980 [Chitinophaga sp. Mgbs1]|uniref:Uncharacterized protein n=1 Tax=Chitinophaga solisilvae TaxID=1233460 RepID=A0A3S1CWA7_9BACT|nr:hypothetical protein [Chitinophaga solisilvae]
MENNIPERNYNTISPSAGALLAMKALTDIPFAREAAMLAGSQATDITAASHRNPAFWARVVHFENRYHSINQLLTGIQAANILELSSGFSFRGLATTQQQAVHYIDTDLPELIAAKRSFLQSLSAALPPAAGMLETLPLNALDAPAFTATTGRFRPGQLAILNEGLLMYLSIPEKEQLCRIIRETLLRHGGYWITADCYLKHSTAGNPVLQADQELNSFFLQHNIQENMFDSFDDAAGFFRRNGFEIDGEAQPDYTRLTAYNQLLKNSSPEQLSALRKRGKIQATWRLKPIPS